MSRAFFLSILLHSLIFALIFPLFQHNTFYTNSHLKKISLNTITIQKITKKTFLENKKQNNTQKEKYTPSKKELKIKPQIKVPKKQTIKTHLNTTFKAIKKQKSKEKIKKNKQKTLLKHKIKIKPKRKTKANYQKHKFKSKKKGKNKKFKSKIQSSKQKIKKQKLLTTNKSLITHRQLLSIPSQNIKAKIYQAINNAKIYPILAKKMHLEGSVHSCFTLNKDGSISNISAYGAHMILNQGAIKTIKRAQSSFPKVPYSMHFCVTIRYVLE